MDLPRERLFDHDKQKSVTNKIKADSTCSSDFDQNHNKPCQQKRLEINTSKPFHPPVPDYFQMYPPTWATMNYFYLDLLQKLTLESEIRKSLSKMDQRFDCSCPKDIDTKQSIEKEETCNDCLKHKHKHSSCKEFKGLYTQSCLSCDCDNNCLKHKHTHISCKESYSQLCLSCHQKIKCRHCGQAISTKEETVPPANCKYLCDSCPTLLDIQHNSSSRCCYHTKHPCQVRSLSVCDSINRVPVEIPVREKPECYESSSMVNKSLESGVCTESVSEEEFNTNYSNFDKSISQKIVTKNKTEKQTANKDAKKYDLEENYRMVPSFFGGTGDEESKLKVKHTKKPRPKSTAYFLPISSLSSN